MSANAPLDWHVRSICRSREISRETTHPARGRNAHRASGHLIRNLRQGAIDSGQSAADLAFLRARGASVEFLREAVASEAW